MSDNNLALNYPLPLAPADSVLSLPALKTEQKSLAPTAVTTLSHIACHPLSADLILPSYLQRLLYVNPMAGIRAGLDGIGNRSIDYS